MISEKLKSLQGANFGTPEWSELENLIHLKRKVIELYGLECDINSPNGKGSVMVIHGRAVSISLNSIKTTDVMYGHSCSTGGLLHRTYLFKDYDCQLLLRPLWLITTAEAMEVAKIFDLDDDRLKDTDLIEWIQVLFSELAGYYIDGYTAEQVLLMCDYLRGIKIALPVYFSGKKYSIDELIELNVIAL